MPIICKKGDFICSALNRTGKKNAPRGAGTLTTSAKQHNMSIPAFVSRVDANPKKFKTITKQRVQLYKNITKKK